MRTACCKTGIAPPTIGASRPTSFPSYRAYFWRQVFDGHDIALQAREFLTELRASGQTDTDLFGRVQSLHARVLEREAKSRSEWDALFEDGGR